mmetsp:Transcript_43986/g.70571  ORF Transcript_43986/g.70571 Transcript_43986/m.70571 type:complete len:136 (-) Transcript_43986:200-607(-)
MGARGSAKNPRRATRPTQQSARPLDLCHGLQHVYTLHLCFDSECTYVGELNQIKLYTFVSSAHSGFEAALRQIPSPPSLSRAGARYRGFRHQTDFYNIFGVNTRMRKKKQGCTNETLCELREVFGGEDNLEMVLS